MPRGAGRVPPGRMHKADDRHPHRVEFVPPIRREASPAKNITVHLVDLTTRVVYYPRMIFDVQPDELVLVFADNVRRRRLELGLTQADLAERIGAHPPYISDIERGIKSPFLGNIARFAKALKTTPQKLLEKRRRVS